MELLYKDLPGKLLFNSFNHGFPSAAKGLPTAMHGEHGENTDEIQTYFTFSILLSSKPDYLYLSG